MFVILSYSATNRLGIGYADVQFDDIDVDLDGWAISWVVTDNILIGADYTSLSGDADRSKHVIICLWLWRSI